jgi:hypothetical protein
MLNIRFGTDYLLHRLKAKNRHGLHSPFVYRLVDEVIYDFSDKKIYREIESILKRLRDDSKPDISPKLLKLIYRIVADWRPQTIIAWGDEQSPVIPYLQQAVPNAKIYNLRADQQIINTLPQIDLVHFDNDHPKQILNHFVWGLPKAHEGTLMIVRDIYRSTEIKAAWAQIKAHPQVTITVDLFWIGLVYFRKGKMKENFLIKF